MKNKTQDSNRRKYIRIDSVLPVLCRFFNVQGMDNSEWLQGFTNNIGKGGICLNINNLKPELAAQLNMGSPKVDLEIETPFTKSPVKATAKISWVNNIDEASHKYTLGLEYEEINPLVYRKLMKFVWTKKLFLPVVLSLIILLGSGVAIGAYLNLKLIRGNKALVGQLVNILQDSSVAKQKIKEINSDKEDLQARIQALQSRIASVEEEKTKLKEGAKQEEESSAKRIGELNNINNRLSHEKNSLQEQLLALQRKESTVTEELLHLDKSKAILEQQNFDNMYKWLATHQNPRTGLVLSFEGDNNLTNWAFTYDQSLVAQAFTYFSEFERAKKIFDFFARKAKRKEGLFLNAYYANDGSPSEYIVHAGPNIWLGIAILQYTNKAKDNKYLGLAQEIAEAIIGLQNQDSEGGVRGGPSVAWYSTEHNLDAYAFFGMLYKIAGLPKYRDARDKIFNWLTKRAYDRPDIPIRRGKGDSTIATDTYAWSIASLGPEKRAGAGMSPDKIMDFAETNCLAEVSFTRPEGQAVKIKGFDFAAQQHIARGGVVSSEWTAQMILSLKIMAEYYEKQGMSAKSRTYELKADEYLVNLCNMIISSPSPTGQGQGCLPYASVDSVDTGHGWTTPQGKFTGSVAGTAYTLFAYYNYNPLELNVSK